MEKSSLSRAIMYKYNTVDWVTLIFSLQDHKWVLFFFFFFLVFPSSM